MRRIAVPFHAVGLTALAACALALLGAAPLAAAPDWGKHGLAVATNAPAGGTAQAWLEDKAGRRFAVSWQREPTADDARKVGEVAEALLGWDQLAVRTLAVLVTADGLEVSLVPSRFTVRDKDVTEFLPAGMAFYYKDFLAYEFRMVKESVSMKLSGRFVSRAEFAVALANALDNPLAYSSKTNYLERLDLLDSETARLKLENQRLRAEHEALRHAVIALFNTGFLRGPREVAKASILKLVELKQKHPDKKPDELRKLAEGDGVKLSSGEVELILRVFFNDFKD